MEIHLLTIFPEMLAAPLDTSILQRARRRGLLHIYLHNLRDYTTDRHRSTDDAPYGGGAGMIMKVEPIVRAIEDVQNRFGPAYVILLSPQGPVLTQPRVKCLARHERLLLICGRYGGIDARVQRYTNAELSIGDYILSGGELPAMVVVDAVARMVPGVVGERLSVEEDSLANNLLQGPQYTRPAEFAGAQVPAILLSGDHAAIARWRRRQALRTTLERRPDLLQGADLSAQDLTILQEFRASEATPHGQ
jgi:tRNA (guanine37-N1)-methyltransferase